MPKQAFKMLTLLYKNRPSNGALTLRNACVSLRLHKGVNINLQLAGKYRQVINWGTTVADLDRVVNLLNKPTCVKNAVNKISSLTILKEANVNVPDFWTKKEAVAFQDKGIILARQSITGSAGIGILVARNKEQLGDAPLYTRYIRKSGEYRCHVFKGQVIFTQQKLAKAGVNRTPDQTLIRCHGNGYVFAENTVKFLSQDTEKQVKEQSIAAVAALGLDFGAADVVVGKTDNKVYVLEVNTAPGLESTALVKAYADAIGA